MRPETQTQLNRGAAFMLSASFLSILGLILWGFGWNLLTGISGTGLFIGAILAIWYASVGYRPENSDLVSYLRRSFGVSEIVQGALLVGSYLYDKDSPAAGRGFFLVLLVFGPFLFALCGTISLLWGYYRRHHKLR